MTLKKILSGLLVRAARVGAAVAPLCDKPRGARSSRKSWNREGFFAALTTSVSRLAFLLFLFAAVLGTASPVQAAGCMCSDYTGGIVDGSNSTTYATIESCSTFGIDRDCTIKNFPAPSGFPITNINYQFWGNSTFFIIFDNVYYTGNMSCNNPSQATFWIYWAPGSFTDISEKCQERMLPVDVTTKKNPSGQTTALIGVPFTYTITAPIKSAWNVSTGVLGIVSQYDDENLYNVVIEDDLTRTGAALTYVSNAAYLVDKKNNLPRIPIGPLNVSTSDNKHLTFSYTNNPYLVNIPPGYNIEIELTVVLDGAPIGVNPPGTTFTNFAEMWFDKLYHTTDGDRWERFHGEYQITPPMTILGPNLLVDKSSTAPTLNVGSTAPYKIDVKNAGSSTAYNVTIRDNIPANMCMFDPRPSIVAGIYQADGTTLVSPLILNTDYTLGWTGPTASACSLTLTLLSTPTARIEPTQRMIITYNAKLDAGTGSGLDFTNVAGATSWFNAGSNPRFEYIRTLSDGTPGVDDFQDSQIIRSAVAGYYFLKTVEDRTTGDYPAKQSFPGDRLRYTLVLQNYTWPTLENITVTDDLGALTSGVFVSGINIVSNTFPVTPTACASCGTNGAPKITLTGFSRPQITDSDPEYKIVFDVILDANLGTGTLVSNQALLSGQVQGGGATYTDAKSDDPNDAGGAVLLGDAATGPTNLNIQAPGPLVKANPAGKTTATIGEQFTYTITVPPNPVNVPLYDVQIKDTLSENLGFVSATAHLASGTKSWILTKVDGAGGLITLKDAITGMDIPAKDQAIIEVKVQVLNNDVTDNGDAFTNTASYTYNKLDDVLSEGIGGSGTTGVITVIEPLLTVTKAVNFVSPPGKVPTDPATVGDVLTYTVTLHSIGTSTAYDANIVDTLPPNVRYVTGSTMIGGVAAADPLMVPDPPVSGNPVNLAWGSGNGDDSLDIPAGQQLVLTYRVTVVDASSAPSFTNRVSVDWTSLDGPHAEERTGSGTPAYNDYVAGPASVPVNLLDNTSIVKSVYEDSYVEDTSTTPHVLRVGDTATYNLTLNLQEYTTRNVVVEDVLPAGMALDSFIIIKGSNNITYTLVAPLVSTGTLTWNFGDIGNSADGNPANDTLVIRYVAKVVTAAPDVGVGYTTSILLQNQAKLSYTGGDPAVYPTRLKSGATIEVRQPQMSGITKVDLGSGRLGTGTQTDPYQINVSSDQMKFQLRSCNNGLVPAYNVQITDVLANELDENSITSPVVAVGGIVQTAGTGYTYTYNPRTMSFLLSTPVNAGQCVTVDYSIGFHTNIAADQKWFNEAKLPQYESLPANGRIYAPTDLAQVWMTNKVIVQRLTKTLISPAEATIGETVTYQITVPGTAMNTSLDNVAVTDTLHPALQYQGATATLSGAPLSISILQSGQTVTCNLGASIPAGQQAVITLSARVANNDQANAGTSFTNAASYTYTNIPLSSNTTGTSGPLTIVEPSITIAKAVSPTAPPSAGDTLHYTVTLTAASGANFSSAYDAGLVDTLSLGLTYVAGSARVNGTPAEPTVAGQTLTWSGINIPEGMSVSVTYDVRVLATVVPGQMLTNSAVAQWTSLDGVSANERTGSGTPTYNDYVAGPAATSLKVSDNNSLTKAIIADTYVDAPSTATDKIARIGDTVTYRLTLKLGEGTNRSVKVQDVLPAGMAYDSLVSITSSTFITYTVVSQPTPSFTGTLIWDLGDVVNTPSGDNTPFDALIIEYKAKVLPDVGIAQTPTTNLTNTATLSYLDAGGNVVVDPTRLVSSDTLVVRQPVMSPITKTGNGTSNTASTPLNVNVAFDSVHFQLRSCNTSGLAPAYSVRITDVLATQLKETSITPPVVAVGGTTLVAGTGYTYTAPSGRGGSMSFVLNTPINAGQCVTIDYNIGFYTDFGPNEIWNNSATLNEYWSLPALSGQRYTPAGSSQFYMTNMMTVTPLAKTLVSPASPAEATIGDTVTYRITVPSTPVNALLNNVSVTDTLHAALLYSSVTGTLYSGATGTLLSITASQSGQTLTFGLGTIPAGQQAVITLVARVDNNTSANAGTSVLNTASYTYDSIPGTANTSGTSGSFTIVEPSVTVAKTVVNVTQPGAAPGAGEILRYTVTLTAASGANFSSAFDAGLVDTLSLGLAYVAGTATVSGTGNTIANPAFTGDGITTRQTLTWDPGLANNIDIVEGTNVSITYDVKVLDTVVAGQVLTNNVTVRWTGLNGDFPGVERTGADGIGGLNDYVTTAAAPPLTVPVPTLTFTKTVDKPVANPGDRLRYTITIQNPTGIRVANFSLVDNMDLLNATPMFQPGSLGVVSYPSPTASYTISGDTLNVTGLNIGPNETQTVVFEAVLMTNLKSGTVVLNQAELHGPWPSPIKSDDPNVAGAANPTQTIIPANGVVYDAVSRKPLAGATLTMLLASTGTALPGSCFVDPSQQNQVTSSSGTYKFDLVFNATDCPAGADYLIAVTAAPAGYVAGPSLVILPTTSGNTGPYSVPVCSADAITATPQCEAQVSATAPTGAVTTYYLRITLDATKNQIYNNHIPVDPYVEEKISIMKTSPLVNVTRGQLVPYTITFKNTLRSTLPPLGIVDTMPAGFKYVEGSTRLDGAPSEPVVNGRQLRWNNLSLGYNQQHTIKLLLIVGSGVSEGEYANLAQVIRTDTDGSFSEVATATVRIVPDPTFDCTDIMGKVFDDRNLNGVQDPGEAGLPGVQVVTARGLISTTDEHGRFHITCAMVPDEDRGSNFILKLDDRTLPTGYRVTTENPRVERATRGKMLRFNFGATIHHVVSMDIADGVFEPKSTKLRKQWQPRMDLLLKELRKGPSVLRLSYLADVEDEGLVRKRLKALKKEITDKWDGYQLTIETEVFWRRGTPP